jgi:hypothetical protein
MKAPLQPGKSFGSAASSTKQLKGLKTLTNNRPTAVAQRKLQEVVQAKGGVIQKKRLSTAEAVIKANTALNTPSSNSRGFATNDWIAKSDEAATIAAWTGFSPKRAGYTYLTSPSFTGGGKNRPPSIDLKAKQTGSINSEFIFHLPVFTNEAEIKSFLINDSGINNAINKIHALCAKTVSALGDYDIEQIAGMPKINIDDIKNHDIYVANKDDVEGVSGNFVSSIEANVNAANLALDTFRNSPAFTSKHLSIKTKAAKRLYLSLLDRISPYVNGIGSQTDTEIQEMDVAVRKNMQDLYGHYCVAEQALSQPEKDRYTNLKSQVNAYRSNRENLFPHVKLVNEIRTEINAPNADRDTLVKSFKDFASRFVALKPSFTTDEKKEVVGLLNALKALIPTEKRKADNEEHATAEGTGSLHPSKKQHLAPTEVNQ